MLFFPRLLASVTMTKWKEIEANLEEEVKNYFYGNSMEAEQSFGN